MALSLQIENVEQLSDGGPVSMKIDKRGLDIGRDAFMDWTLPDPERFISGKHCEIHYRNGEYWLHDVSTNGTSVNEAGGRLTEPHQLKTGDRIYIGGYIVGVTVGNDVGAPAPEAPPQSQSSGGDVWGVADAAEAIDRNAFNRQSSSPGSGARPVQGDLSEEHIEWGVGNVSQGSADPGEVDWSRPGGGGGESGGSTGWETSSTPAQGTGGWDTASDDPWGGTATPQVPPREEPAETPVDWAPKTEPEADTPKQDLATPSTSEPAAWAPPLDDDTEAAPGDGDWRTDPAAPAEEQPIVEAPPEEEPLVLVNPTPRPAAPKTDAPPSVAPSANASGGGDFVAAFERGAGMPAGSVASRSGEELAEELGRLFKTTAQNVQAMLAARAETKSAMRSSERTMIGALENNPLKFSPSPEDALRIMFGEKTRSYLDAGQTLDASFSDLQRHQVQTFTAMQQALAALIEDLSPEKIAGATAKDGGLASIVSSRRAKLWDTYVERFNSKSAHHERGMIDAFMILFSEMYDRQG